MKLTWMGHSCFVLESDGYEIVIDPYDHIEGLKTPELAADKVICSHGHHDHNADYLIKVRKGNKNPFRIYSFETYHDNELGSLRGLNQVTIFCAEGIRLAHLGDLGCDLTEEQYEDLRGVDVLLIPVGGTYTVNAQEAKAIADRIGATITIPMHYRRRRFGLPEVGTIEEYMELCDDVCEYGDTIELGRAAGKQTAVLKPRLEI